MRTGSPASGPGPPPATPPCAVHAPGGGRAGRAPPTARAARRRLVAGPGIARSKPSVRAREALLPRLHGGHPYGTELPEPGGVAAVEPSALRTLHSRIVSPARAVLTLVG